MRKLTYDFPLGYSQILERINSIDTKRYSSTRNFLDGAVTKISPYLTRGAFTLPQIREMVLAYNDKKDSYKFIQELAWREYFQKVWTAKGDEIFSDLRFNQGHDEHDGVPTSITNQDTGIEVLDETARVLTTDGYMHNHARMTIASVITHLGHCHWWEGSRWMYYHLLDGDLASNMLSWQWVAGTSKSKPYTTSQSLIDYWSATKQPGTFLDYERDEMLDQSIPSELANVAVPDLVLELPKSENISLDSEKQTLIYHPWHLDPLWHKNTDANRVLVIETSHFEQFPVSRRVFDFIISLAQENIPGIQIFVGELDDLLGNNDVLNPVTRSYPAIRHWDIVQEPRPELFPEVQGYYKSFFAFWKECEKYI